MATYRITWEYTGTMELEAESTGDALNKGWARLESAPHGILNSLDMEDEELTAQELDEGGYVV
jgi:hypothetical protein